MQINGLLYQQAKASIGSRSARKRGSKKSDGVKAITRVKIKYQELVMAEIRAKYLAQQAVNVNQTNPEEINPSVTVLGDEEINAITAQVAQEIKNA